MGEIYNVGDVIDKTLIARKTVPVYRNPVDTASPYLYVAAGDPVGVVYSYLPVNAAAGRNRLWWQFWDGTHNIYYAPHQQGLYDITALREQGILSEKEKAEKKAEENMPWYERLIKKYGIWVVVSVLGAAAIKGYLSRSEQLSQN